MSVSSDFFCCCCGNKFIWIFENEICVWAAKLCNSNQKSAKFLSFFSSQWKRRQHIPVFFYAYFISTVVDGVNFFCSPSLFRRGTHEMVSIFPHRQIIDSSMIHLFRANFLYIWFSCSFFNLLQIHVDFSALEYCSLWVPFNAFDGIIWGRVEWRVSSSVHTLNAITQLLLKHIFRDEFAVKISLFMSMRINAMHLWCGAATLPSMA